MKPRLFSYNVDVFRIYDFVDNVKKVMNTYILNPTSPHYPFIHISIT